MVHSSIITNSIPLVHYFIHLLYSIVPIHYFIPISSRDQGHIVQELDILWDPERFTFTYEMNGKIYELYDGQQILYPSNSHHHHQSLNYKPHFLNSNLLYSQTSTVAQFWRQKKLVRGKLTVELKKTETKEEKTLNMEISSIIGIGLYQLQFANNDELDTTRRKMVGYDNGLLNNVRIFICFLFFFF